MSRILVAEDDPHILRVICLWLSQQGHDVDEARNGLAALQQFGDKPPDILITDVNMPGMDGLELLHEVSQNAHHLRGVVVLTNRWDHREISAGHAGVNVHVVPKPFSPSKLADLIAEIDSDAATMSPPE